MTVSESGEKGDRDDRGRFVPGHGMPGPGRPKGSGRPDPFALAQEFAERAGLDVRAELWAVLQKLIEVAKGGDVAAAKLVLAALTASEPTKVQLDMTLEELILAAGSAEPGKPTS